ncbi:MAG TPA: uracil phosphoribosyltransferase [Acidimicrobiaceae bacterium]|jgi:uracil phosphoribosyltransferase|nr:uracil phosphoribosyltransferase [Acidimicrobiaceae bacterium]
MSDSGPRLTVVDHPLVRDKVARVRDVNTKPDAFRRLIHELSLLAAYEALHDLPTVASTVQTPLTTTEAHMLVDPAPAVVGVLRAGLSMVEAVLQLLPEAMVGHIGLYRDHDTLTPVEYLVKLPTNIEAREVLVVDPMLATGGSIVHALDVLKRAGASKIRLLSLFGAPEGVAAVHTAHPDVPITLAALDTHLNDFGYIMPGIGDAGDRLYGTK